MKKIFLARCVKKERTMYTPKKRLLPFVLTVLTAILCLSFVACSIILSDRPTDLNVQDQILSWTPVKDAVGYIVTVNGEEYHTDKAEFDVFDVTEKSGDYEFVVNAVYADSRISDDSAPFTYKVRGYGGLLGKLTDDGYISISKVDKETSGRINIPSEINGVRVVGIEAGAFRGCEKITAIVVPDGVLTIGNGAFGQCTALERIKLPALLKLDNVAFSRCSNLKEIDLTNGCEEIGMSAFSDCSSLKRVALPSNLISIGESAFSGADSLEEITIADNARYESVNGVLLEKETKTLIRSNKQGYIPEGVEELAKSSVGSKEITTLELPSTLKGIDAEKVRLYSCSNLTSIKVAEGNESLYVKNECVISRKDGTVLFGCKTSRIPSEATAIGKSAFARCVGLKEIVIPANVKKIGDEAFFACVDLVKLVLENGVEEIGKSSFATYKAYSLEAFLPVSLKKIGKEAFCWLEGFGCVSALKTSVTVWAEFPEIGDYALLGDAYYSPKFDEIDCTKIMGELKYVSSRGLLNCDVRTDENGYSYVYSYTHKRHVKTEVDGRTYYSFSWHTGGYTSRLPVPVRYGYDFLGWSKTLGSTEIDYPACEEKGRLSAFNATELRTIEDGVTFYAVWQKQN